MSNHITATQNKLVAVCYSNLKTYIPTYDFTEDYVLGLVSQGIKNYEDYLQKGENYPGITWHIDSVLNANGLAQCMVNIKSIDSPMKFVVVKYPYDLGENETISDVLIHYPYYNRDKIEYNNSCYKFNYCDGICKYCPQNSKNEDYK